MCNRYQLKSNLHSICRELKAEPAFEFDVPPEVFPKTPAPVVVINRQGGREVRPMVFGMGGMSQGAGATASRYPLNNTRIESHHKWPWKKSFEKYHCLVPMSSFREACYWGENAGSEVSFAPTAERLLLAAGIFNFATDAAGQTQYYMSILMRPALPYVMQHGHHRSPFFLRTEGLDAWLDRAPRPVAQSLDVLRNFAAEPQLSQVAERAMAASWMQRQAARMKARDAQLAEIEAVGPLGFS